MSLFCGVSPASLEEVGRFSKAFWKGIGILHVTAPAGSATPLLTWWCYSTNHSNLYSVCEFIWAKLWTIAGKQALQGLG